MDIEKTIRSLRERHYTVQHFATSAEAAEYLTNSIKDTTVGIGGSKTVEQLGLYELLSESNTVYWHWKSAEPDTREKANAAAVYLTGANAISEDGEILNIDGAGNRLAAQVYGRKRLYIIAGTNKICPDFNAALYRARNTAAVLNCRRFNGKTPCRVDGKCHDCRSLDRICNALLVLWAPMAGMTTEVILIDEALGF